LQKIVIDLGLKVKEEDGELTFESVQTALREYLKEEMKMVPAFSEELLKEYFPKRRIVSKKIEEDGSITQEEFTIGAEMFYYANKTDQEDLDRLMEDLIVSGGGEPSPFTIRDRLTDNPHGVTSTPHICIRDRDDKIVGYIGFEMALNGKPFTGQEARGKITIVNLIVDKDKRGLGLGKELFNGNFELIENLPEMLSNIDPNLLINREIMNSEI